MPFLTGFAKRKPIKYGTVFPGSNLTDFPVLIVISGDSDLTAELSGGGGIAVTSDDGTTEIPFGLYPSSDPTSGDLILRFKASPLTGASTGDVMAYLYYDAGETTVEDKAGVVSSSYKLFTPLDEDPAGSGVYDWVTDALTTASEGNRTATLVSGQVGDALDDIDELYGHDITSVTTNLALSAWINVPDTSEKGIIFHVGGQTGANGYCLGVGSGTADSDGNDLVCLLSSVAWLNFAAAIGTGWHHIALTRDATTWRGYVDGVVSGTTFTNNPNVPAPFGGGNTVGFQIGSEGNAGRVWPNPIDEVRFAEAVRSVDWLEYEYENEGNNSDTVTLGTEETDGGGATVIFDFVPQTMVHRSKTKVISY